MCKARKMAVLALLLGLLTAVAFTSCILVVPASSGSGPDIINQAWNIIFSDYVDKSKLDPRALSQAAIKGMVEELNDPHTAYIDPEHYKMTTSGFQGKIEGIGAQVGTKDNKIIIIAPLPGSPAYKAGIRAGDIIVEVDGKPIAGMSVTDVVLLIRGPKGTSVSLLLQHEGENQPVKLDIIREEINLSSVNFEMKGDIAYIRISSFSERTDTELIPVIEEINRSAATGIILDLRDNPGGILEIVVNVASHFLKEGVVVEVVDNQGKRTASPVKSGEVFTALPMVVLVNGYSASGSEVLAGALQDYGRATIAGTKTFGKGSVNVLRELSDGSGLYITSGRWLTPKGRLIEGQGLAPDIRLDVTGDEGTRWAIDYLHGLVKAELPLLLAGNVG